jgi:hypothetical protein
MRLPSKPLNIGQAAVSLKRDTGAYDQAEFIDTSGTSALWPSPFRNCIVGP